MCSNWTAGTISGTFGSSTEASKAVVVAHVKGELKEDLANFDGYSRVSADMNQLARAVFKEFHEENKGYSPYGIPLVPRYLMPTFFLHQLRQGLGAASRRWAEKKRHSRGHRRQGLPHSANLQQTRGKYAGDVSC